MVEFTIPKKSKVVTSIKRGRINDVDETVVADVPEILGDPLAWLPRLGTITPLEWDAAYGLVDLPSDEFPEWHLINTDVDNLPVLESVRARAIWSRPQQWRETGTPAQILQTLTTDRIDFLNPESYSFTEMADFTQRLAMCVLINSNAASRMRTMGVLTYQESVIQRVFGNDNWTNVPDDVIGDGYDDVGSSS